MYPQYQQPQPPFPIDSVFQQPIQYQPGQPPFQINLPVAPQLQQFLPLIATAAIDAVQARYGANQLRVFLYNQMSMNGYNNNDFLSLVKSVAQYVEMSMTTSQMYPNIQAAIFDGAEKITEMYCADNLRNYPVLQQLVDPVLQQRSQGIFQVTQTYSQQVNQWRQSQQMQAPQGYPQPSGYPQIPGGYGGPQTSFNQPQNPFNQPQSNWNTPVNASAGIFNNGQSPSYNQNTPAPPQSVFLSKPAAPAPQMPPVQGPVTQWDNRAVNTVPVQSAHARNIHEGSKSPPLAYPKGMDNNVQGVLVKADDVDWVPSEKYPYTIAYDSSRYELYYFIEPDGAMKPVPKLLTEEQLMDRSKHFKSSICPPSLILTSDASSKERIANLTEALRTGEGMHSREKDRKAALALVESTGNQEGIDMLSNQDIHKSTVSDEEVWMEADIDMLSKKKKENKTSGFSTCAYVNDVMVSINDPKPLADRLQSAKSFLEVSNILKDVKCCVVNVGDIENGDYQAVNYFNNRLTSRLNRYLTKQLGLSVDVSSFIEDAPDIFDYIEKKFGERFSNPLRASQRTIIRDCCSYATGEVEEDLLGTYVPDKQNNKAFITFFYCTDFFVSVDAYSNDLNVDIKKTNVSVAIMPDQLPLLSALAEHIFEAEAEADVTFNRRLIRTLDRVVFEINRSVIDPETYLINLH